MATNPAAKASNRRCRRRLRAPRPDRSRKPAPSDAPAAGRARREIRSRTESARAPRSTRQSPRDDGEAARIRADRHRGCRWIDLIRAPKCFRRTFSMKARQERARWHGKRLRRAALLKPPSPAKVVTAPSIRSVVWLGVARSRLASQLRGSAGVAPAFPTRIRCEPTRTRARVKRNPVRRGNGAPAAAREDSRTKGRCMRCTLGARTPRDSSPEPALSNVEGARNDGWTLG